MKAGQAQLFFLNALLLMLCCGMGIASFAQWPIVLWGSLMAGLCMVCLLLLLRSSGKTAYVLLLLFLVLGGLRFSFAAFLSVSDISHRAGQEVQLAGTLLEAPRIVDEGENGVRLRYVVEAEELRRGGERAASVSGSLYIYAHLKQGQPVPEARIGDRVLAGGTIRQLHGYGNPGRVDVVQSARARGITAQLSAGKGGVRIEPQERLLFLRQLEKIRAQYLEAMQSVMPAADAAAIFAMLFGGYEGIRPELLEAFTTTGIVHILSVSGSHITILAASIAWLGGMLRLRQGIIALLVALAIIVYSLLAGCVPPVLRAGAMGLLMFLALVLEREKDAQRILTITALVMLLWSPLSLYDISFQLSFAATAGLLYMGPQLRRWLKRLPPPAAASLAITISAQLFTLPFLAWYFHVVSISSLLANLIVVPIVEFMIVLGLAAGLLAFILPAAGRFIFFLDSLLLGAVYELTRLIAALPGGQVYMPSMGPGLSSLYYLVLGIGLQPQERRAFLAAVCWQHRQALAGGLASVLLFAAGWQLMRPAELAVHFIDVGQGDAALVVTPHGRAFLIDTGGTRDARFDVGSRVVVPYLLHYGVRSLDGIFLTHAHEDHAAGTAGILRKVPTGQVFIGSEGTKEYAKSMKLSFADPALERFIRLQEGQCIEVDGVRIEILYAPAAAGRGSASAGNEVSNVIRVCYGKASFLFTGDLIKEQERVLLDRRIPLQASVLKVAHHGSKTSTSAEFLQAASPQWAVIGVGADNSFGHPHAETLQRLADQHIEAYRTDEHGAVVFYTDGQSMRMDAWRE